MIYFKKELWQKMQELNNESVNDIWRNNINEYNSKFLNIKKKLPSKFIKIFEKENGFHDYIISDIRLKSFFNATSKNKSNIELEIENGSNHYVITLINVKSCNINIFSKDNCISGNMSWGYTEFDVLDNKKIRMSILCDIENEFDWVFENIKIIEL